MTDVPQARRWGFTTVSPGLDVRSHAAPTSPSDSADVPDTVSKPAANNALFDVHGEPLSAEAAAEASTWRSHHAFSARCEQLALPSTTTTCEGRCVDQPADVAAWRQTMAHLRAQYRSWEAVFHLAARSTDGQPNILLSVAPLYFPYVTAPEPGAEVVVDADTAAVDLGPLMASTEDQHRYDARVLQTPLIWEEPLAVSVECSARGMFLWSDYWMQYGVKLADRCLARRVPEAKEENGEAHVVGDLYEASVRLQWALAPKGSHASGGNGAANEAVLSVALATPSSTAASPEWQTVTEHTVALSPLAREAVFLPHVTLMEKHDSATVV